MTDDSKVISPHERFEMPELADIGFVFDALERRDDQSLWEAAKRAPSHVGFFEQLRNQVGFTTYTTGREGARRSVAHHCAMLMVPVILPAGYATLRGNPSVTVPIVKQMVRWMGGWLQHKAEISFFNAPISYEEICIWTPSTMREKLEHLAVKKEPTLALPPDFNFYLPAEAPSLAFFVAAAQQPLDYPALPVLNPAADLALVSMISGAIQVAADGSTMLPVETLVPNYASEAMEAGILRWLSVIDAEFGIGRWDVQPVNQDLVVLQLEVGERPGHTSPIPLRAHQLGLPGIERIIGYVSAVGKGVLADMH